ncbi:hypothetical protein V8E52_000002 [Russula decolorans]
MSNTSARNDPPETGGADLDHVTEHGQNIIDSLRWKFASSGKMQRGDFYMDQSLGLLQRILPVLGPLDQKRLWATYTRAQEANDSLENAGHFGVRRFFKALEYERRSKKAFKLVIKASSQVIDDDLMSQIAEAIHNRYRTLFSAPNDVAIRAFDRAEAETTPSEVTGGLTSTFIRHFRYGLIAHAEGPVIPGLHGQDASLPDMLVNGSRIVLVDVDDSADRVERHRFSDDIGREMFSPYSDCEEELSDEDELSGDDPDE